MTELNTLAAALATRDDARQKHAADEAALQLGRERIQTSEAELTRLADEDSAAVARHAGRLERQVREGKGGPLPALVPSDKHIASQITAQRTLAAAKQMLASLEAAAHASRGELEQAEQALQRAALAAIAAEATVLAGELGATRAKLAEQEALLNAVRELPGIGAHLPTSVYVALRDDVNTPIGHLRDRGDLATPVNQLGRPVITQDAHEYWRSRLDTLLRGEGVEPPAAAVA